MYAIRQLRKGIKEEKSRAIIKLILEGMEESITAGVENWLKFCFRHAYRIITAYTHYFRDRRNLRSISIPR